MEVYPSPSRPYPISIPCFRSWSSRSLTTSYVVLVVLFPQIDNRPVGILTRQMRFTEPFSQISQWQGLTRFATPLLIHSPCLVDLPKKMFAIVSFYLDDAFEYLYP